MRKARLIPSAKPLPVPILLFFNDAMEDQPLMGMIR